MDERSVTEIHRLRAEGYSNRFLKYLGYDPTLVENAAKGAYDIQPLIERGGTRQQLLEEGFQPGAIDFAIEKIAKLKLAGKSNSPAKPKRQRTTRDLVRFGNQRGINVLKRR